MCGISGMLHFGSRNNARETIAGMTHALKHRGPDALGQIDLAEISLGHTRLSIIDLSVAASQPMTDRRGRYQIVYNGEIYNFRALREELQKTGAVFNSHSDTEVILEAYHHWGTSCVDHFEGMFAFAIWDTKDKTLYLARDRFGKKPLYYSINNGCFSFASELTALMKDSALKARRDPAAINCYLALGYILAPMTLYEDVFKLPQATWMKITGPELRTEQHRYWDYANYFHNKISADERSAKDKIRALFDAAVKKRLIADVPVGAFLSGGIDSSSVVAFMKRHTSDELHTFSVGFEEAGYNESEAAAAVAQLLKTIHHGTTLPAGEGKRMAEECIGAFDEPFCDNSMIPMLYVSRLASGKVKVVLSGDGADELFAGYITYKADRYYRFVGNIPRFARKLGLKMLQGNVHSSGKIGFRYKLRQFLNGTLHDGEIAHYSWRLFFHPEERVAIMGEEHRQLVYDTDPSRVFKTYYEKVRGLHWLDRHLYVDGMTWLTDDILVKVDRTTMASGLEARAPYLDHHLAEYAASLPPEMKLRGSTSKYILRKMLSDVLPPEVLNRKKSGFNAPVGKWLGITHQDEFRSFNKFVYDHKPGYAG